MVRPWTKAAFPVWDYAELLPLLRGARGFWEALLAVAHFNRPDGRANYLAYAQFALTWQLAGDNPLWWQLQRALFMLLAGVLFVAVARRLGATPLAAAFSALLFMLAVPSTEGWLFLMGEPLAVVLLLLLLLLGAGYRTLPAWRGRAVVLALLALGVMLTKEILGVTLPAGVLFILCWEPGVGFRLPRAGPRERWLVLLLLGVLLIEGWSALSAYRDATSTSYAARFGAGGLVPARFATLLQAMLLPTRFATAGGGTILYPANLAFLLVLLLGLVNSPVRARPGRVWWALGLLSYPLIGAVVYTLWPRYSAFYGIPFFAASAGLFLAAATAIERAHRIGRWLVVLLGTVAVGYAAIVAERVVGEKHATAALAREIALSFPRHARLDTLLVGLPSQGGRRWPITAQELRRYAVALGVPDSALPLTRDAFCEEIGIRLRASLARNAVLNDQNPCGRLPVRTQEWNAEVRYFDWLGFSRVRDTMRVEILAPSWTKP